MAGAKWTPEEDAMLRELYSEPMANGAIADAINAAHGNGRSANGVLGRARTLGLRKPPDHQHIMPPRLWTPERAAWFRGFVPGHTEAEISAEHERIYGTPLTASQIGNAKTKLGVKSGTVGGRFKKGMTPHNKGKRWSDYVSPEGQASSRRTCFKKGEVRGAALAREQPVGSERVNLDGYIEVKVHDGLQSKPNSNFRLKHRVEYEKAHGPIPRGCNVVFADHDKRNFAPDNLVAVPRRLWAQISRQRIAYHDAASLRAAMSIAELVGKVREAECAPRACRACGDEFEPRYPRQRTCDRCLGRKDEAETNGGSI